MWMETPTHRIGQPIYDGDRKGNEGTISVVFPRKFWESVLKTFLKTKRSLQCEFLKSEHL